MKKLKERWNISSNWQILVILFVFAITGTSATYLGKPILTFLNISPESLHVILYWTIRLSLLFIVYQFMLIFYGWIFGQFHFFLNFEKKMLNRLGFKRFLA